MLRNNLLFSLNVIFINIVVVIIVIIIIIVVVTVVIALPTTIFKYCFC